MACFARSTSELRCVPDDVDVRIGDLDEPETLFRAMDGCDALLNIASLGFGHAQGIVRACQEASVHRAMFVSTTAIFTSIDASSKSMRCAAEATIRDSGLAYSIVRPTMIYGTNKDRNISRLVAYLRRWSVIPIFGDGNYLQQPVYVEDVASALVACMRREETVGRCYNIAGQAPITYNEMIDVVASLLGKRIHTIHLPVVLGLLGAKLYGLVADTPRFTAEQILRLNEDKRFDYSDAARDFGYQPRSFQEGAKAIVREGKTFDE